MTQTISTTWRRITVVATITAAAVALAAMLATPAHATVRFAPAPYQCTTAADEPNFIGWATISHRGCIAPGMATTTECRSSAAYRWTGTAWRNVGLSECGGPRQVYVYPYTSGWSWVWSQQTGWLAVQSHLVHVRVGYGGCAACYAVAH
jgi:hypothetical protein